MSSLLFGDFRLEPDEERLWRGTTAVDLRPKTFAVLRHLAERPGKLVLTEELLDDVWGETAVTSGTLNTSIRELRKALGDDAREPRFIETVHRRGFRFVAEVRARDGGPPTAEVAAAIPAPAAAPPPAAATAGWSVWWLLVASIATLAVSVPATLWLAGRGPEASSSGLGAPGGLEFILVLRGQWAADIGLGPDELEERLQELRSWTSRLAAEGTLVAASDLTLEPGIRYGTEGGGLAQDPDADYVMGILTLRMDSYREALALARACPHLKYGGSVTVRRAGSGFFKVTEGFDFVR